MAAFTAGGEDHEAVRGGVNAGRVRRNAEYGCRSDGNAGRVDLIRKLDKAVKGTETGIAIAMNMQTAIIVAMTSGLPKEQRPTMEKIEKEMAGKKGQLKAAVEQACLLSYLYAYRILSDAEIAKYIDFAASASCKRYHDVTAEGMSSAITNGARVLGRLIVENARKKAPEATGQKSI